MDIALVNIHLNRNRTPLCLQSLYQDIFCAKSLNCWFFQIEYASNIDITVILELLGDAFT